MISQTNEVNEMAKKDLCEIVLVIDRSGSMGTIVQDAIGSLNTFLEDQKKVPGEATVTVVLFNDEYHIPHTSVPINDLPPFDETNYRPAATTALLDAVGKAVDTTGERLGNLDEADRPEKVLVAILTDGLENSSKEYNRSQIFDKIKHQRETYGWEFMFLAANQDAFAEGAKLGIDPTKTINFDATADGVRCGVSDLSFHVTSYRMGK